ncbi:MAG: hypothetical protein LBO21_03750 [Synergistaceae bacterium]|jgi:hypothetical protein|nr:hypothetical protein [Synergistaceae bacterium]
MNLEELREHLLNWPLIEAIRNRYEIDELKRDLAESLEMLTRAGVSDSVIEEIDEKRMELVRIRDGYDRMIEDIWQIEREDMEIIWHYRGSSDEEIDALPDKSHRVGDLTEKHIGPFDDEIDGLSKEISCMHCTAG